MRKVTKTLTIAGLAALAAGGGVPLALAGTGSSAAPVLVTNPTSSPVPVAGTVEVGNLPSTQSVSGTVNVGNLPSTQQVAGTVNVGNLPSTQAVTGTVAVTDQAGVYAQQSAASSNGDVILNDAVSSPAGGALWIMDTVSVIVGIPTGSKPRVEAGCGDAPPLEVPVQFAYTQGTKDYFSATMTGLALRCGGSGAAYSNVESIPLTSTAGAQEIYARWYGHRATS